MSFAVTRNFNGDSAPNDLPVIVATQFFLQPALAIYYCATVGAQGLEPVRCRRLAKRDGGCVGRLLL